MFQKHLWSSGVRAGSDVRSPGVKSRERLQCDPAQTALFPASNAFIHPLHASSKAAPHFCSQSQRAPLTIRHLVRWLHARAAFKRPWARPPPTSRPQKSRLARNSLPFPFSLLLVVLGSAMGCERGPAFSCFQSPGLFFARTFKQELVPKRHCL